MRNSGLVVLGVATTNGGVVFVEFIFEGGGGVVVVITLAGVGFEDPPAVTVVRHSPLSMNLSEDTLPTIYPVFTTPLH